MPDDRPVSLHQQTVDYTVHHIAQLSATVAVRDLELIDVRSQLAAAQDRIAELEAVAEAADIIAGTTP